MTPISYRNRVIENQQARIAELERENRHMRRHLIAITDYKENPHLVGAEGMTIAEIAAGMWSQAVAGLEASQAHAVAGEPETAVTKTELISEFLITLANSGNDEPIRDLCAKWGVQVIDDRSVPPYRGRYYMNQWATIRKLCQYVLEYQPPAK